MTNELDPRLTVGVCDTQPVVVEGLRSILNQSGAYRLLDPARTMDALANQIFTLSPRIAIVDKAAGNAEILEWTARIRGRGTAAGNVAIVVWGTNVTDAEALRFLQAGASGVLRKSARTDALMACFDAVANGVTWLEDNLFHAAGGNNSYGRPELTLREQQVLQLVEQGMRNKEIADELGIRPGTVKIHLKHIFEKSGVRGRYGLALSTFRPSTIRDDASTNVLRA